MQFSIDTMKMNNTAQSQQLIHCLSCGNVAHATESFCPHCHARISSRKHNSKERTWAYLITAILLFFPANLLPISYTSYLLDAPRPDTILSSIILLWHHGSYLIAAIIFLASIMTPFAKIAVLLYLLSHDSPRRPPIIQTKLYRWIHFIGRWSMIDVFVVALLGALIHGRLAQITPAIGVFAFAGVVVFTMFATESFDIRLLWDHYRHYEHSNR